MKQEMRTIQTLGSCFHVPSTVVHLYTNIVMLIIEIVLPNLLNPLCTKTKSPRGVPIPDLGITNNSI